MKWHQQAFTGNSSASFHDTMADFCEIIGKHLISIKRGKILDWVRDFDSFQKDSALWRLLDEHLLQFSVRVNFISYLTLISKKNPPAPSQPTTNLDGTVEN